MLNYKYLIYDIIFFFAECVVMFFRFLNGGLGGWVIFIDFGFYILIMFDRFCCRLWCCINFLVLVNKIICWKWMFF